MVSTHSISAVFPCYNDGGTIASVVLTAVLTVRNLTSNYEIIVVDDGSTDTSREILAFLEQTIPSLRVIYHEKNLGYGAALRSGFQAATKELIFYTDGDAQYDIRELEKLYCALTPNVDIAQGYKIKRHDPLHRICVGWLYQHLMRSLFKLKISDVDCDFRLMRKKIFDVISLTHNSGVICVEMVKKIQEAGFQFTEVPVNHFFRAYGKSQFFNFRRLLRVLWDLLFLWHELVWKAHKLKSRSVSSEKTSHF